MNANPLVTVYIATHNRAALLLRALESVLNQTYPNIEIIVADDGSSDETAELIQPYVESKKVIYLRNETPKGACATRNLAIMEAKGEYITGLDDDDEFTKTRIRLLLDTFIINRYSCLATSYAEKTPSGVINRQLDTGIVTLDKLLHANVLGNQVFTKTAYLKEIGGFDEEMPAFQDYDTWVRLLARFGSGYKLRDLEYIWYTDHQSGRISESPQRRVRALTLFIQKHEHLMSPKHKNSMAILSKRLNKLPYSAIEFFQLTSADNFKYSLSYFLNINLAGFKYVFDKMRMK